MNFEHLEVVDQQLAALGRFAERYFVDDPNTALVKTRQFAERFAWVVAERTNCELKDGEAFAEVLRRLQSENLIPRDLVDLLHALRKQGNRAAHSFSGERKVAFDAIKMGHRLGVWLHAAVSNQPKLAIPFVPPKARVDDTDELKEQIAELRAQLASVEGEVSSAARQVADAVAAQVSAEERARRAEEEREIMEQLALEAERKAVTAEQAPPDRLAFAAAAVEAARGLALDEADTRTIIDEQLRAAGWEADTSVLRHSAGHRPVKGRNLAIAEWPTHTGPADYALFAGEALLGIVEAKRKNVNVAASIRQAERYARGVLPAEIAQAGTFEASEYRVPFVFSTNGRGYFPQLRTQSGIWFRDVRRGTNEARPLDGWPSPAGLLEKLDVDVDAAEAALSKASMDFEFKLRPYQRRAIEAVESSLAEGRREMLVAMATGSGKTKLSIAMIYRLLQAKRFKRICFVVDRSALGEQAEQAFETTKIVGARTFAEIFGLKGLADREIDRDVRVHVCTIQSLVKRVLTQLPGERPPVDQYDLIMVDECHRGYLLDREMSDAEMTFRDQDDYVSKYRRALEYFDAVKIGLTATPALHTSQIFGEPVYRYGYRAAVIDGWLIDHDPPHLIRTALGAAGIQFEAGEQIDVFNSRTGEIDTTLLEDRLDFSVDHFNRRVLAPEFNRVVAEELAERIDIVVPNAGKTLIFAVSDKHADDVVDNLRRAYRALGLNIEDALIQKITGSIDRPRDAIRAFKNEDAPRIAVTVDLLTTGIDVPQICNLVFLRRVNSRILYDQMIGRATRLCPDIGKAVFQIYDAVDLYPTLQQTTEMKPVVVNPKVTFDELFEGLAQAAESDHQTEILDQIIVKLSRKIGRMHDEVRRQYEGETGETPEATLQRFRSNAASAVREWAASKPGLGKFFDFDGARGAPRIIPIYMSDDYVVEVVRGYGDGVRPSDFIEAFTTFVRDNRNRIDALNVVLTRPRDLTRGALRELRLALDANHFTDHSLQAAWRDANNEDIAASIVGFVRQAALGDPLVPYSERVDRAIRKVAKDRALNDKQRQWLGRIGDEMKSRVIVDRNALDEPPFSQFGGFKRIDKTFDGLTEELLRDIADATWEQAA